MAQDLAEARPFWRLRVSAVSVQAVAHAFAMLGLVSAEGARAALTQAGRALGLPRAGGPEPVAWPGSACDYWNLRAEGRHALAWAPPRYRRRCGAVFRGSCRPALRLVSDGPCWPAVPGPGGHRGPAAAITACGHGARSI